MNELTINLQTGSKIPLYEQIYNLCQREYSERKTFKRRRNCLLPERLARHLEVSRSTIELAYEQLDVGRVYRGGAVHGDILWRRLKIFLHGNRSGSAEEEIPDQGKRNRSGMIFHPVESI